MLMVSLLVVCAILGYLLGSIPTGYWVGRGIGGIDIREHGSGSMGATNILRTLGKGPALLVLAVDLGKGMAAVGLAHLIAQRGINGFLEAGIQTGGLADIGVDQLEPWMVVVAGFLAVVGHSRPIWLGFKGGKSVATSLGILLAMAWPVALSILGVWGMGLAISRIVSFSSVLAAVAAPILMWSFHQPLAYGLFALAGGLYILGTHRRNIERLLAGTEPRIGKKLADQS